MKKNIYIIGIMILIIAFFESNVLADFEEIEKQKSELGINEFIKKSKEYSGEFFKDIDISEVLNDAIKGKVDNYSFLKRILNLFGNEFINSLKAIGSILIIIIIHSLLKSISEGLENNNISKLIYYVQYILIVTIIMSNFSDIVTLVQETTTNLIAFMNMLIPLLITLIMFTGSITTSGIIEPIILFLINFVGNIIKDIIIPSVLIFTSLVIISKISDKVQINEMSKFLKSSIIWFLGIILTVFVGVVSLEGTLSSSIDGITAKTAKTIVSSAIPVVGKILGDAVDTVLGCGVILKNAVGVVGVLIVLGISIIPILKLSALAITYKVLGIIVQPIADEKIINLLKQIGDIFKIFLAILFSISVMLMIGTTLIIRISNSGMMYR